ncbi:chitinase-3-like protein 1 [Hylaeus volcanicus]|uniref:chitinase-3-like protein 1 n=1 Tax=Hylaeus volcanicus TaxID=313075 RepID=UPI0023B816BB|nr:chitinase-3-like protein 1 [Hylaeus volcanicus]XP_053984694.1 chitinase-3-like protein 1 [Hylaeus volcanicus]XP_053984695.1 chitinase-3-like protein 1 [Hylaeus volcanicus]
MFKTVIVVTFMILAATDVQADKKIVCYFGSWAVYRQGLGNIKVSDINPRLCTHIIYAFTGLSSDNNVRILDPWADLPNGGGKDGYGKFTALRELSPGTKALIAIGGWNEGSSKYSRMAGDAGARSQFVQNVVKFLQKYNFDGFDVDWEYPNQRGGQPSDKENFVTLLKELRKEFDNHGYILSVAAGAAEASASKSYLISQVLQYVHFVNLMAYDFNGSWNNYVGINAPLYASSKESGSLAELNVNAAVRYWLSQGAPAEKLILGIPSYGRSFTLANAANNGLGASAIGPGTIGRYTGEPGTLGYNEICENLNQGGWTVVREPKQLVPYAFKGNQWVGYDDPTSVQEKAKYINSMGLGGAMVWSVETDDFRGTCGEKYPLLTALNRVLRSGVPIPDPNPVEPTQSPSEPTSGPTEPAPPSESVCTHEGFVRDPKDCGTFYQCQKVNDRYKVFTFHCPDELAFDESQNVCNYKSEVPGC